MGACASLCRVDTAPRGRDGRGEKRGETQPPPSGDSGDGGASSEAAPPAAAVRLGFASGFTARYELGDALGHGQFATVRAARDRDSGAAVAVKIIPKSLLNEAPENAEHIRREVMLTRRAPSRPPRRAARAAAALTRELHRTPAVRQVSILKALRGRPHVVRLYEAYEDEEEAQLVLQCVSPPFAALS